MSRDLIGIDPAVGSGSRVGVAWINGENLVGCWSIRVVGKPDPGTRIALILKALRHAKLPTKSPVTVTVEGQRYYAAKKQSSPQGLIALAQVAGALAGQFIDCGTLRMPTPQDVSTLSKTVRHKQALAKMGLAEEDVAEMVVRLKVQKGGSWAPDTAKLDMNDVLDAICLARWGGKQDKKESRK